MKLRYYTLMFVVIGFIVFSRFVNISWGLPYPFHPDERNMVVSIMNMRPENNFNPEFFAYGQLSTYLGLMLIFFAKLIIGRVDLYHPSSFFPVSFDDATLALRYISVIASLTNAYVLYLFIHYCVEKWNIKEKLGSFDLIFLIVCFPVFVAPFFVQFSHFGTTESLLMLLFSSIVYISLRCMNEVIDAKKILLLGLLVGLASGTKISATLFGLIPCIAFFLRKRERYEFSAFLSDFYLIVKIGAISVFISVFVSPYNIIEWNLFTSSLRYESGVALGNMLVFYTGSFAHTIPVLYQFIATFPYVLGMPLLMLFILGFIFLPWNRELLMMRIVWILFFFSQAFMYAKWTRFLAHIYPLMGVLGVLFLIYSISWTLTSFKDRRLQIVIISIISIIGIIGSVPGIGYIHIFQTEDTRFQASRWIYKHIEPNSKLLSETANVIDIPITIPGEDPINFPIQNESFNFYDLDVSSELQSKLSFFENTADYILVPSRRIFYNYSCQNPKDLLKGVTQKIVLKDKNTCAILKSKYPLLDEYYMRLFRGNVFEKVAEFSSYPTVSIFGFTLWKQVDELAEETWSVFDHPVIRIYKRKIVN